jgi:opacity protein-like surface antigen
MRTTVFILTAAMLGAAIPARAQDKKVEINLGGGYSVLTGEARQHAGDAGVFEAGVTFNVTPTLGFKTNYNYTALGREKTVTLPVASQPGGIATQQEFSVDVHMHDVTFDLVANARTRGRATGYVLAGPGVYHRTVNLTTPAVGFVTVCDPFWYVCYPTAVAVDQVLGTRSSTDLGMNIGGGLSFKVGENASLYFDVRYVYIWGPTFDGPGVGGSAAKSVRANGQAVPITVGIRF